jgi:hypothetical protein
MRSGKLIPLLCGGLLVLAAGTSAEAVTNLNSSRSNIAKAAPKAKAARAGTAAKAKAKGTIVKSKSNISNN